jgi:hypothetical protein
MSAMTTIAGKSTKVGDELWHSGLRLWAQVTATGIVTIKGINDQTVKYTFTTGGLINGKKQLSWHQPLEFDVPSRDITKYQALLNAAYAQFGA